jgi:hypothetical protein
MGYDNENPGQPGLQIETLSQNIKNMVIKPN